MFWAIAAGAIDTRGFEFEQVLQDIQTLNEWALEGRLEVTAISLHAYPFVQDRYALLPHGASIGSGYGPILVAREPLSFEQLRFAEIVVPGRMTTAFLTAAPGARRVRAPRAAVRPDPGRGLVRPRRRRPRHPRGPAHLRGRRACTRCSTSASGGCSRPGCRCRSASTSPAATSASGSATSRRCCSTRSRRGSRTARDAMRYAMRFGRGIDAATPSASSACT